MTRQLAEHAPGILFIAWLSEHLGACHHHGVGGNDRSFRSNKFLIEVGLRFFQRKKRGDFKGLDRGGIMLVDRKIGVDLKRYIERCEQLTAPRRPAGQYDSPVSE